MWRITTLSGVFGLCLLSLSYSLANSTREFVDGSLLTEGAVLRVERLVHTHDASAAGMRYNYVIWFPTRSGKTIAIQRKTSDAQPYFRPGDPIPIRYDPKSPKHSARIGTVVNIWGTPLFLGVAGAACLVFAAAFAVRRRGLEFRPS